MTTKGESQEVEASSELSDGLGVIAEDTMKDLLFSLAWLDCSAYHSSNVNSILARAFPGVDFKSSLNDFVCCKNMPPGKGCPR